MEQLEYKGFDGHIILYCKNHYKSQSNNIVEDLKMIWAIRCGYEYNKNDNSAVINIIDRLYLILLPTIKNHDVFQQQLHDYILSWLRDDLTIVEKIIHFYKSKLFELQVKKQVSKNRWKWIIKLPKPKKQVFNRILRGNGKYEDFKLIN